MKMTSLHTIENATQQYGLKKFFYMKQTLCHSPAFVNKSISLFCDELTMIKKMSLINFETACVWCN